MQDDAETKALKEGFTNGALYGAYTVIDLLNEIHPNMLDRETILYVLNELPNELEKDMSKAKALIAEIDSIETEGF